MCRASILSERHLCSQLLLADASIFQAPYIQVSDLHDPVISVVALVPTVLDRGIIIGALHSESVTAPSHDPNFR